MPAKNGTALNYRRDYAAPAKKKLPPPQCRMVFLKLLRGGYVQRKKAFPTNWEIAFLQDNHPTARVLAAKTLKLRENAPVAWSAFCRNIHQSKLKPICAITELISNLPLQMLGKRRLMKKILKKGPKLVEGKRR